MRNKDVTDNPFSFGFQNISEKNPTVGVTNESQKLRGTAQKLTSGISATETTLVKFITFTLFSIL